MGPGAWKGCAAADNQTDHHKTCRKNLAIKGTLSRTFFGFFSKTSPKLRLSSFNHTRNAPRKRREGYLANCLKKRVTVNSFHRFFQATRTELEKVRLTLKLRSNAPDSITVKSLYIYLQYTDIIILRKLDHC